MFAIKRSKCTICTSCVDACPTGAIEEKMGYCEIDPKYCVECGACLDVCQFGAIFEAPLDKIPFILEQDSPTVKP